MVRNIQLFVSKQRVNHFYMYFTYMDISTTHTIFLQLAVQSRDFDKKRKEKNNTNKKIK